MDIPAIVNNTTIVTTKAIKVTPFCFFIKINFLLCFNYSQLYILSGTRKFKANLIKFYCLYFIQKKNTFQVFFSFLWFILLVLHRFIFKSHYIVTFILLKSYEDMDIIKVLLLIYIFHLYYYHKDLLLNFVYFLSKIPHLNFQQTNSYNTYISYYMNLLSQ